ncbi:MAG: lamin tail domain-containing protein [Clostridia bacterium]|nr:lamin tail domain-containing protein [Clostridia bacterium]
MSEKKHSNRYRNNQWKGNRQTLSKGRFVVMALLGIIAIALMLVLQMGLEGAPVEEAGASPLRISEVMSGNSFTLMTGDGAAPDWIEIENTSGREVNLSGWGLMLESDPTKVFTFPAGALEAGGCAVVYADDGASGEGWHAPFRLSASGGSIALLNRSGAGVDLAEFPEMQKDQSYARRENGQWEVTDAATPGRRNSASGDSHGVKAAARTGPVQITEVMTGNVTWHADENGLFHDYVEIANTSSAAVSLEGWYLSDDEANLTRWQFPDVTLPAGGRIAVHCSGQNGYAGGHLHVPFRLSSDGDNIILTSPAGAACRVSVPQLNADQAWSLSGDVWTSGLAPTPGAENTVGASAQFIGSTGVHISEMIAVSSTTEDWIELYNASAQPVDISGWGLSDNANRPRKWQFPEGTVIQPGQYMGVFCDGADGLIKGYLHTNYSLSADGGYSLVLSDPDGNILDRMFIPRQYADMSYGRLDGANSLRYFETPTPIAENTGANYAGRAGNAVYSVDGGFYKKGETVTVTLSAQPGERIYYTLDCTDPTEKSTLYTGPITIRDTAILRTRVYAEDCLPSFMDARSYLYDVKNGDGSVYVVSLVSDPYNLTSDEAGIMVKGNDNNYWREWEREAHVEVFSQNGGTITSQECAVRQQGQTSRDQPQQSLKLIARSQYGSSVFNGHIFRKTNQDWCSSFILRTSNDDAYKIRMRDSVLSSLADSTENLLYQETEVCVAYINGEYWGHYNLRETANTEFICQYEGWVGKEAEIDYVRGNDKLQQGSDETFLKLLDWVKKNKTNSDRAYEVISSVIDVDNYIDYMVIEMYVGNTDPSDIKRYRNEDADGKWRWILFDLDWGFSTDTNSIARWLAPGGMGNGGRTDNTLFIACMKNPTFRDKFLTRFGQQLATTFTPANMLARFEERYDLLKTILPDHRERWNDVSENKYNRELKKVIEYAKERPGRLLVFFKYDDTLKLSQSEFEKYFGEAMDALNTNYKKLKRT